ncbi:MAG: translation elongation factor Ts [Pseudohongiellaceae bacterium]|nr:translation elongation factor Ts [Pseudohongiellaceae bacterium]
MSNITAAMVKDLRERTGLGMMDCKKALVEAGGDIDKAIDDLRKASGMKAAKKASRVAADGIVMTKVSEDGNYGVIVEVNSETDFVARDDNFQGFANAVLEKAFASKEKDVAALMEGELENAREALVQKIGENIGVRRIEIVEFENINDGIVDSYVHGNNRIAVLVALKGGDDALAKDIAMHVAAVNPTVVKAEDVPKELLAKESEIYSAQARESGKPEEIIEKMIQGRLRKFVAEITLLEQQFVKDPDLTIAQLLKNAGADVVSFTRFEVGEGIEKEEVDFATEVAQAAGS